MARAPFNRQEADSLLPYVAPLLVQLRDLKRRHDHYQQKMAELSLKMRSNGHVIEDELRKAGEAMQKSAAKITSLIERVQSYGCELKDIEMGLIDFRASKDGREVYLCWKLGEEHIAYWHDLDTGYAGRQPLEDAG